jgi:hypothetical protein
LLLRQFTCASVGEKNFHNYQDAAAWCVRVKKIYTLFVIDFRVFCVGANTEKTAYSYVSYYGFPLIKQELLLSNTSFNALSSKWGRVLFLYDVTAPFVRR